MKSQLVVAFVTTLVLGLSWGQKDAWSHNYEMDGDHRQDESRLASEKNSQLKLRGMDATSRIQGQFIVVFEESSVSERVKYGYARSVNDAVADIGDDLAWRYHGRVTGLYSDAILAVALTNVDDDDAYRISRENGVAYVEADQLVELFQTQSPAVWGLDRIDQRDLPLNNSYTYSGTGAGVNVYVIDSGIYPNSEFGIRLKSSSGFTAINDGYGNSDCNGHGTHVAGTIGGSIHGVAKGVNLYPVRVFGCDVQNTSMSLVLAGVNWVFANKISPAIANMSFGYTGSTSSLDQATTNLIGAGVVVVAAAGNSSTSACGYSPAKVADAITVGGSTSADQLYSLTNSGSCVDVFAPADNVQSAGLGATAVATMSGTSMAAPHVSGVAALIKAATPSASPSLVAQKIRDSATTRKLLNPSGPTYCRNANKLLFSGVASPAGSPSTVLNLQAEKLCSNKYFLSWASAASSTSYEVYVTYSPEPGCESFVMATAGTTATVSGGPAGGSAKYRVRACNSIGCGGYSLPKTVAYFSGCP